MLCFLPVLSVEPCAASFGVQDPPPEITSENPQDPDDERHRRQVMLSRQVLLNASPDIEGAVRIAAAQELLVIELPEAASALTDALKSGQPVVVSAVVTALRNHPALRPDLLDAVIEGLAVADDALRNQIGLEMARYEDAGVSLLAALIDDAERPLTARLNAIHALGSIRTRASAAALMAVLNPERTEPAEVTRQTCDALTRLTGFSYGNVPTRWQEWWRQARNLSPEGWSQALLNALTDRITTLEQQMQSQRNANQQVVDRLIETYRELFASISREDEQLRIEPLLSDPLPGVRLFAVSRIERMLRDGVRISDPLQQRVPAMLADGEAEIRRRAALVLQQLAHPELTNAVTTALTTEPNQSVAIEFLKILGNNPGVSMLNAVLARIDKPATTDIAADAVWNLLAGPANVRQQVAGEHREAVRGAIDALGEVSQSASVLRVKALVTTPNNLSALLVYLDSDDAALKRAVAEGIAHRGMDSLQPLIDRATDPIIYPFVVAALANGPASTETVRRIADMPPPNGLNSEWAGALDRTFARLAPDQVIASDDLLAGIGHVTATMRANALQAALPQLNTDETRPQKIAVTSRLASILIAIHEPARAHSLLEGLNGVASTPELQQLRFRAALLAEKFDRAAEFDTTPASWVALVASLTSDAPDAVAPLARRINDEIRRRFDGELSDAQRASLDQAISMLPPIDDSAGGGTTAEPPPNTTASADGDDS